MRRITSAGMPDAGFKGTGVFEPAGMGLRYEEKGTLNIPGQQVMRSERRYLWDKDLNVFFEDGRFFHTVPATGGETEHWCDPDQYFVTYLFAKWPDWRVTWRVTGPRKDYLMMSDYKYSGPV